ncbi:MAG: hypothetical protein ACHP6I_03325 [Rickettsiales bacterium]
MSNFLGLTKDAKIPANVRAIGTDGRDYVELSSGQKIHEFVSQTPDIAMPNCGNSWFPNCKSSEDTFNANQISAQYVNMGGESKSLQLLSPTSEMWVSNETECLKDYSSFFESNSAYFEGSALYISHNDCSIMFGYI